MAADDQPYKTEVVGGGYWREDGTFQAPEGWPEGAGWVVRNPDGSIADWGKAEDMQLVASTDDFNGPLPDPSQMSVELKGVPSPGE